MRKAIERIRTEMARRDNRPAWHALAILVIIAAGCLLFYRSIPFHGTLMYTDMTWPNSMERVTFQVVNSWYPYGSFPTTNYLMSFFWIYPSSMLARLIGLTAPQYMLLTFVATFALAGVSMYSLAYYTIRRIDLPQGAKYAAFVGSVFAALIYMYNPWSLQYFRPYFVYPIYAAMPLLFLAMIKTLDSPSLRNLLLFSMFLALVNTSYLMYWVWGILVTYFIFHLASNRFARDVVKGTLKAGAWIVVFYAAFNMLWLLPSVLSVVTGKPFMPFYAPGFNPTWLSNFSVNNTIMNNLRLLSNWEWRLDQLGWGLSLEVLTFAIPVLSILALVLLRKKIARSRVISYWAIIATSGLLLATGTSSFLRGPYNYLAFNAPGSGAFGWTLRAPERWLFFVPVFFALLLGLLVSRLLAQRKQREGRGPRERENRGNERAIELEPDRTSVGYGVRLFAALSVIVLVLASLCPIAHDFASKVFSPVDVPRDYSTVDRFINSQAPRSRVAWLPFFPAGNYEYEWAPDKHLFPYSVITSNPSLSSIQEVLNNDSYFNWFESLYRKEAFPNVKIAQPAVISGNRVIARLFAPFAAPYLIFDGSVKGFDFGNGLESDRSLTRVLTINHLKVYKADFHTRYLSAATRVVKADTFFDNLALAQKVNRRELARVAFFNGQSYFGGPSAVPTRYGVLDLKKYRIPLTANGDFEETLVGGMPAHWYQPHDSAECMVSVDSNAKPARGRSSLRMINQSGDPGALGLLTTWEEPVQQAGDMYCFEARVKYRNANWTCAIIEGYRPDLSKWELIAQCPNVQAGTAGWKRYSCSFLVPPEYSRIRPVLVAGWAKEPAAGPSVSYFDRVMLSKVNAALFSDMTSGGAAPSVDFKKLSSQKYRVDVAGAADPFMLVHAEAYDNHWVVKTEDGETIDPVPLYRTINGFPIDRKGSFSLILEYQPQQWFLAGLVISLTAIFISLLFLLVLSIKHSGRSSRFGRMYDRLARRAYYAVHSYTLNLPHMKRKEIDKAGADPPPAALRPRRTLEKSTDRTASPSRAMGTPRGWVRDWPPRKRNIITWSGAAIISVLLATFVSVTSAVVVSFFLFALLLRIGSGVPLTSALILLACCPLLLLTSRGHAETVAAWSYYFLAMGIILLLVDYFRSAPGSRANPRKTKSSRKVSNNDT